MTSSLYHSICFHPHWSVAFWPQPDMLISGAATVEMAALHLKASLWCAVLDMGSVPSLSLLVHALVYEGFSDC